MLYLLNLYSALCQLYLNKTGREKLYSSSPGSSIMCEMGFRNLESKPTTTKRVLEIQEPHKSHTKFVSRGFYPFSQGRNGVVPVVLACWQSWLQQNMFVVAA